MVFTGTQVTHDAPPVRVVYANKRDVVRVPDFICYLITTSLQFESDKQKGRTPHAQRLTSIVLVRGLTLVRAPAGEFLHKQV